MHDHGSVHGVWCATLTPLDASGDPDATRLAAHARRLFASGVDGVALFGTTGEGQSFSVRARQKGLDGVVAAGIAPGRIVAGTGCAALEDAITLTRHAVQAGCAGALVLPPFFFRGVSDEGVYAAYARLVDGVGDDRLRLYLYHIPQVTGVPIPHDVISRLSTTFPGVLAGIKDSSGDFSNTRLLLERFRRLSVFVGHEPHLPKALAAGGAGTICGIANLYPRLIRRIYDQPASPMIKDDIARIEAFIAVFERIPIFAAFKAMLADAVGDPGWEMLLPPLVPLDRATRRALLASVDRTGIASERAAA